MTKEGKNTLDLVLKGEWFEMIKSGEKKEEYREIKDYWTKRLVDREKSHNTLACSKIPISILTKFRDFKYIRFRKGYGGEEMTVECNGIYVGKGKEKWGAPKEDVYIIKLGDIIGK